MKNLKILLLMAFPVAILSCNDHSSNRNKNNDRKMDRDNKEMKRNNDRDTMVLEKSSMFIIPASAVQDNDDEDFVKEAASGGLMEVEAGRYAEQNASNPRVKKFGSMMVSDHSKANEELKSIASGKNINVPANMLDKHQNMFDGLKKERGSDFDKAYMKEMVEDHRKDIDLFQKQAEKGKDADLKSFASKMIEKLQVHLDSAKSIHEDLGRNL